MDYHCGELQKAVEELEKLRTSPLGNITTSRWKDSARQVPAQVERMNQALNHIVKRARREIRETMDHFEEALPSDAELFQPCQPELIPASTLALSEDDDETEDESDLLGDWEEDDWGKEF